MGWKEQAETRAETCPEEHDEAFGTGPASFQWPDGGAWTARVGTGANWWRRVAEILVTRLAGVSRAPQGAPNPGFAGRYGGWRQLVVDNGGWWQTVADGDQNGYPL